MPTFKEKYLEMFGRGGGGSSGPVKGPLDHLRDKKPDNLDQAEWDQTINDLNKEYAEETNKGMGFSTPRAKKIKNFSPQDVTNTGKHSGVLRYDKHVQDKRNAATEIAGSARNATNAEQARQANIDLETQQANAGDAEALRQRKLDQEKASAGYHATAGDVRKHADEANKQSQDLLAGLGKDYFALNDQDQHALAKYLEETDPMMAEIVARASDPADLKRQLEAYDQQKGAVDKYKSLSDPEVTGKERYMSELARREFESADKSNREAVSEQLANRGLRSGGQQIAGQQSNQQQLSQDRLLKELGIQAGAVDRSMTALEGYSNASQKLGLQSDAIRSANDSQRQYEDTFRENDAVRRAGLAGERKTASDTTTGNVSERDKGYYDAGVATTKDVYGRNQDADSASWDATDKDYDMGGDYADAARETGATRVARAVGSAAGAQTAGDAAHERLIGALGIGVDQDTDEEERNLTL
jgi:hypothetical protein